MSLPQSDYVKSIEMLNKLLDGDAWLISIMIASNTIKMVCEFSPPEPTEFDSEKKLYFDEVSHLNFSYKQNVFGSEENDISTIDVMKIYKEEDVGAHGRWRVSFELTYGKLEFSFGGLEITG